MKGWIKSIRKSKGLTFMTITDGKKDHQLTLKEGEHQLSGELKVGASFKAECVESKTPKGLPEWVVSKIDVIGKSDDEYPIQPKHHTPEFLRTIPELRGRTKILQATWKIRHHLTQAIHQHLSSEGFFQYYTPIITQADCEGAGETFDIKSDWMSEKLTVSGQLHGEVGMMSLGKIYTFSPCFRAEKSTTKKHLSEFWMIEPEMAWSDLEDSMDVAEDLIRMVVYDIHKKCKYEFEQLGIDSKELFKFCDGDYARVTYKDICKEFDIKWGEDISSEMEQKIVKKYETPVFITHYPKDMKPFYMKKDDEVAYCFDLIFPGVGELIGGSEREEDYDTLKKSMEDSGLDMDKMKWYLDTRKWGSVPHSGFGLGFERLLMYLTSATKIHDVIPFPVSY
jgi:asparaginyl-tRNA synthetase